MPFSQSQHNSLCVRACYRRCTNCWPVNASACKLPARGMPAADTVAQGAVCCPTSLPATSHHHHILSSLVKVCGSHRPLLLCYPVGIDKLQFQPNGDISGMVSAEGELVPLKTRIKPSTVGGAVEKWLIQVLTPGPHLTSACLHAIYITFQFRR